MIRLLAVRRSSFDEDPRTAGSLITPPSGRARLGFERLDECLGGGGVVVVKMLYLERWSAVWSAGWL